MKLKVIIVTLAVLALLNIPLFYFMRESNKEVQALKESNKILEEKLDSLTTIAIAGNDTSTVAKPEVEEPTTPSNTRPQTATTPKPPSNTTGRKTTDKDRNKPKDKENPTDDPKQEPINADPKPPATASPTTPTAPPVEAPPTKVDTTNSGGKLISYKVKKGDTLFSIAQKHHVTIDEIKKKIPARGEV